MRHGSVDWLVGEILSLRGGAVVLEPEEMRDAVAARARELESASRRRRARAASRADGKAHRERRSVALLGVDLERAAVRLGDRARDEEPQAGAGLRTCGGRAAELLEDEPLILLRRSPARCRRR